jgi:3-oxoacyl-[acyl-carrier protein] reductase
VLLKDKVALITGAAQGIGRVYAQKFAENGANVVVADINLKKAQDVAAEIVRRGANAIAVEVDVASESSATRAIQDITGKFGVVDILVNNAAVFSTLTMKPFDEITGEEWDAIFRVNTRGTFLMCKAVAPAMKRRRSGRIINTSSGVVDNGRPNYLHYLSSKAAINGMTRGLATELGEFNVTVNTISPYGIATEVPRETISEAQWKTIIANQAVHIKGTADSLVGAVLFLASDHSAFITGQTLHVNGGTIYH